MAKRPHTRGFPKGTSLGDFLLLLIKEKRAKLDINQKNC